MDYFYSLKDSSGYIHSIDNLIFTYYVHDIGMNAITRIIEKLHFIRDSFSGIKYWENLNISPCSKYSFFQNAIHLDDGIYLLIGHYTDYEKDKGEMYVYPMLRLEINPNKHANKPIFKVLLELINDTCYDAVLNRYDYAVDIPLPLEDVQVFSTRKEKGLYKGTRYFGQRNKNGFCRIYDKSAEQGLDSPLTRVEHVISMVKTTKTLSLENVYIKVDKNVCGTEKLSPAYSVIAELCMLCAANDIDYEDALNKLQYRGKKAIREKINECSYEQLKFDKGIHDKLVAYYKDYFGIKTDNDNLIVDSDGFINLENYDPDLPFD